MGVAGVAWATLIAQGISAVLSFAVLIKNLNGLEGKQKTLFDTMELSEMTRIAIPSILQQSTVSIGMMLVQSVVNGFGSEALAGFQQPCVLSPSVLCQCLPSEMPFHPIQRKISEHSRKTVSFRDFTQPVKWSLSVQQLSASFRGI